MWQEVRIPWVLLFHIAVSAALKQFRTYGYLTPVRLFLLVSHNLSLLTYKLAP